MSTYSNQCAICGRARSCGAHSNSRICNSRNCEIAYEEHLNRGWACCARCGTCGGKCCNPGGDHAFLNASLLCRVLDARPGVSPEAIIDAYMQQIPEETYENSCIYHGIHGCGLPREVRSITCNNYLCYSLQLLRNSVEKGESSFLLAASNLRDAEATSPEVYRIQVANDQETVILQSAPSDR